MRPDAHRFLRADWCRFVRPDQVEKFRQEFCERKYRPDQLRDERGRWADERGGDARGSTDTNDGDTTELSAQRRRGPPRLMVNGRLLDATPGQQVRLTIAEARARNALARVRKLDPNWKPTPSFDDTVEGRITTARAEAQEAEARLSDLARNGIGPGPYAGKSIPARGSGRYFTREEREKLNSIGYDTGCHTCGTKNPETSGGNFVADHQPPSALNFLNEPQRLFPQCLSCSVRQGGWVNGRRVGK